MLAKGPPARACPPRHAYTLVEEFGDGSHLRDVFNAPSNCEAIARAQEVVEGEKAELWRGEQLIWSGGRADDHNALAPPRGGRVLS